MSDLLQTPLHPLHLSLGARMVAFAGYEMPVQYTDGVMKEHLHTRRAAGLFDVSHMGQVSIRGGGAAAALEALMPMDVQGLPVGRQRYGLFTNDQGGIEDDLMVANCGDHLYLVVNAACKVKDIAHLRAALEPDLTVTEVTDRALLALQGPQAEAVLKDLNPAVETMRFMDVTDIPLAGVACRISRSGYTGEDGFEISVPSAAAEALARRLLDHPGVAPIGLGARDSLRLEAGLCLYGHDMDDATSPVEAGLAWAIPKVRRTGGARAGGFPGAERILTELTGGSERLRVGLKPQGRAPMREGIQLFASDIAEAPVGRVTSGGFGPSVGHPIAMGLIQGHHTTVYGELRGTRQPLDIVPLPFTPANFKRQ
ncbi:MAG: glycine cleavage system aminomethyltransferase GcvT [Pseudomonadota bacterium]